MADKKVLTDRAINALKPAPTGKRVTVHDALVPGLVVRVTDRGHKAFYLIARLPPNNQGGRRLIGEYGKVGLDEARDTARRWHELIRKGVDPKDEQRRVKDAARREQASRFSLVAERFLERTSNQRRAKDVRRIVEGVLVPAWGDMMLADITRADVVGIVSDIAPRAPAQARAVFGVARALFNWAIEVYGLEASPCDRVNLERLIGKRRKRDRVLNDDELRAFWAATEDMGYPYGTMFRLLLLTGARKNEILQARWSEIDTGKALVTIPPERFKSDRQHLIPLSGHALSLLEGVPRTDAGVYVFSTTLGARPVSKIAEAKARLDEIMRKTLTDIPHWVTHDLRRTLRTRLASLRVPGAIAELVLGHGKRGLEQTYDQHEYLDEMREALEAWAGRLRDIVEPPPDNVLRLTGRNA